MSKWSTRLFAVSLIPCLLMDSAIAHVFTHVPIHTATFLSQTIVPKEVLAFSGSDTHLSVIQQVSDLVEPEKIIDLQREHFFKDLTTTLQTLRTRRAEMRDINQHLAALIRVADQAKLPEPIVSRFRDTATAFQTFSDLMQNWIVQTEQATQRNSTQTSLATLHNLSIDGVELKDHLRAGYTVLKLMMEGHISDLEENNTILRASFLLICKLNASLHFLVAAEPDLRARLPEPRPQEPKSVTKESPSLFPVPTKMDSSAIERLAGLGPDLQAALPRLLPLVSDLRGNTQKGSENTLQIEAIQLDLKTAQQELFGWQGKLIDNLSGNTVPPSHVMNALTISASEWFSHIQSILNRLQQYIDRHPFMKRDDEENIYRERVFHNVKLLVSAHPVLAYEVDLVAWLHRQIPDVPVRTKNGENINLLVLNESALYQLLLPLIREMRSTSGAGIFLELHVDLITQEVVLRVEHNGPTPKVGTLWKDTLGDLAFAHISDVRKQLKGTVYPDKADRGIAFELRWPIVQPPLGQNLQFFVNNLGVEITRQRELKTWDVDRLAHESGVDKPSLILIEQGKQVARYSTIIKIGRALNIAVECLFDPSDTARESDILFADPLTGPALANRLEGKAQQPPELSYKRWGMRSGRNAVFIRNALRSLRANKSVEVDTLYYLINGVGLTMQEALAARNKEPTSAETGQLYALRPDKAEFAALPNAELISLLQDYDPTMARVVDRVLKGRPAPISKTLKELAQETGKREMFLYRRWNLGMAMLRQPIILEWLKSKESLNDRIEKRIKELKKIGITEGDIAKKAGISIKRIFNASDPSLDRLAKMAEVLDTNFAWLGLGKGPIHRLDKIAGTTFTTRYNEIFGDSEPTEEFKTFYAFDRNDPARYRNGAIPRLGQLKFIVWTSPKPDLKTFGYLGAGEMYSSETPQLNLIERSG